MYKWPKLLLLILFSSPVYSQSDSTFVPYVAYWEVEDEYDFRVTKIKEQWQGDQQTKYDSSSYTAKFKVVSATDTSYLINWIYENQLTSDLQIPEALAEKFSDYSLTNVVYSTDELGVFKGVQNWEEISQLTQNLMNDLFQYISDTSGVEIDQNKFKASLTPFVGAYSSQEGIERLLLSELQYFHFPFGLEYPAEDTVYYEEKLPNMFGGDPIRGDVKLYFDSIDFENSTATMIQEMSLNSEDSRRVLTEVLKKMNLGEIDLVNEFKDSEFDIDDYNRYEFFFNPGVPILIETVRKTIIDVNSEKGKRLDRTIIELIN